MLLLVAVMSLLLGWACPNGQLYRGSSLMAPVIVSLGSQNGLIVPLVAVHLFVILESWRMILHQCGFCSSCDQSGDPIKTGGHRVHLRYSDGVVTVPLLFNTDYC